MKRCRSGKNNPNWKGGWYVDNTDGHIYVWKRNHPKSNNSGHVREYILIAESALGKYLPDKAVVHHHLDEVVICENQKYHMLLHQRKRASDACGNASWRKCHICKKYDAPENVTDRGGGTYHKRCNDEHQNARKKDRR